MGSKGQNPFPVLSIFFHDVETLEEPLPFPVTGSQQKGTDSVYPHTSS